MTESIFRFRCPACTEVLQAERSMAGATTHCTSCEVELEIPKPPPAKPSNSEISNELEPDLEEAVADEAPIHFRKDSKLPQGELDMTPMVDVTFLLLIFFMVTASFSVQKSLELPVPKSDSPSTSAKTLEDYEDDPDYVTVRIDSYNTFHVTCANWEDEREAPSKQELLVKIRDAKNSSPGNPPNTLMIVAHKEAIIEKTAIAIDAGTVVGMNNIKYVTTEED